MLTILLYTLLSTALFYIGSRAKITSFLWSRYPLGFAAFMDCPACVGFWWGLLLAIVMPEIPFGLPTIAAPLIGLCSLVWTPIGVAVMQHALDVAGSAVPAPTISDDPTFSGDT